MKYLLVIVAAMLLVASFGFAKREQKEVSRVTEYQFEVDGIVCAGCLKSIEAALLNVPGVKKAKVDLEERRVKVVAESGKLNAQDLIQAIEQASGDKFKVVEVTERLSVEEMTCTDCVKKVKATLSKIDGVKDVKVSLKDNEAIVTHDPRKVSTSQLLEAINKIGYRASLPR